MKIHFPDRFIGSPAFRRLAQDDRLMLGLHTDERGSALVLVFWLMAILSLFLFTSMQLVSSDVSLVISQKQDFRANQLCEMGLAIAANSVVQKYDPMLRQYDAVQDEGFEVRIRSEAGRLNINVILKEQDRELLEQMFTFWGMELEQAEELSDTLIDWVDPDEEVGLNGAEYEWYEEQGFFNYPFNRPFYDLDEMALVKGIEYLSFVKPNWRTYFTLYSSGKLDLVEADSEMIQMVAGVSDISADDFVYTRQGEDHIDGTEDDMPIESVEEALLELGMSADDPRAQRFTVNDNTVRIESTGRVGNYQKQIVLVLQNRESNPVILHREEVFR